MRIVIRLALVLWVAVSVTATWTRAQLWLSERALWTDAAHHAPDKPRPWVNLGKQYALDGAPALAADAYERGLTAAQKPGRSKDEQVFGVGIAAANLAILRCQGGDLEGAQAIVRPLLARANDPDRQQPIATAVSEVNRWLEHQRGAGGCAPVLSY